MKEQKRKTAGRIAAAVLLAISAAAYVLSEPADLVKKEERCYKLATERAEEDISPDEDGTGPETVMPEGSEPEQDESVLAVPEGPEPGQETAVTEGPEPGMDEPTREEIERFLAERATVASEPININTADASLLMSLSGIGESKAAAIIAYRDANGRFEKTEDIMKVPGIKEGVYSKISDMITVE